MPALSLKRLAERWSARIKAKRNGLQSSHVAVVEVRPFTRPPPNLFDRLPLELIQEILGWIGVSSVEKHSLRRLFWVCLAFRNAIVNSPSFWTDIQVDLNPSSRSLAWIELKIQRSQGSPLQVSLRDHEPRQGVTPAFEAVLGCSERWESFTLNVHIQTLLDLLPQIQFRFSSLRHLKVSITPFTSAPVERPFPLIFKDAPPLDTIIFSPVPGMDISSLPLRQLSHLYIDESWVYGNEDECPPKAPLLCMVLHEESRLQELHICLSKASPDDWLSGPMKALHLKTLVLRDSSVDDSEYGPGDSLDSLVKFLDLFTAPSLLSLSLSSCTVESSTLLQFVTRSSCRLESMDLKWTLLNPTIVELLKFVSQTLTHLQVRLSDPRVAQTFPQFSNPSFLPHLASLVFFFGPGDWYSSRDMILWVKPDGEVGESKALDLIGTSRCEPRNSDSSPDQLPATPFRQRLEHFELKWDRSCIVKGKQQLFARLPIEESSLDTELMQTLDEYCEDLASDSYVEYLPIVLEKGHDVFPRVTSAQYLYHSPFHLVLAHALTTICPDDYDDDPILPGGLKLPLKTRHQAACLLKRLLALVEEDVPRLHWRYNGGNSLIFTSVDHEFKRERNAALMVFGVSGRYPWESDRRTLSQILELWGDPECGSTIEIT